MIVSPSISLVAAGVASGICFILFSTLRKGRAAESRSSEKEFVPDDSRCACCLKPFLIGRGVRCSDCGARSCRKGCSRWDTHDNAWHCLFCHQRRSWLRRNEKWFETFGGAFVEEELHRYFSTAKSRVYVAGVEDAAASSGLDLAAGCQEQAYSMEAVRDAVERIVEKLIGNVNDAAIDRLYDHPAYDRLLEKYSVPLADTLARLAMSLRLSLANSPSPDAPTMANTALRELVERAVEEARKLPGLGGSASESGSAQEGRGIAEQSYEDLLATAILNKVIEKFQKEQVDGNSNVLLGKPPLDGKYTLNEIELGLDEGVEEGSSSLEPLSQDECSSECSVPRSRLARNHPEQLSLTIEERIEEVTTTYTSDEERRDVESEVLSVKSARRVPFPEFGMDIIDPSQESSDDSQDEPDAPTTHTDVVSPIETWEENWLFQRKRAQAQPDAVAMLVPNSSADFKALIGDKDAEDTSDLSECSSAQSDEEIEKELIEAINNVVPRSPKRSGSDVDDRSYGEPVDVENKSRVDSRNQESKRRENANDLNGVHENPMEDVKEQKNVAGSVSVPEKERSIELREDLNAVGERIERDVSVGQDEVDAKDVGNESERIVAVENDESKLREPEADVKDRIVVQHVEESRVSGCVLSDEEERPEATRRSFETLVMVSKDDTVAPEVQGMPKTPTTTPRRTSEMENAFESSDNENCSAANEKVLNSLESAKKILMNDSVEAGTTGNRESVAHRTFELHAEDEAQQESEYTEHYDIATQRHLDSLTKAAGENDSVNDDAVQQSATLKDSPTPDESKCREAVAFAKAESASYATLSKNTAEEDARLATPPRPGSIAEREHKKWENAPPIENNPYSEENIQRRLFERQYARRSSDIPGVHAELPKSNGTELEVVLEPNQPDIKRFGRDYYINESKAASGEKARRSTSSSRPSSSLSQRSSSTAADHEQQEESHHLQEVDSVSSRCNDAQAKVARWQRNNAELNRGQRSSQRALNSSPGSPIRNGDDRNDEPHRTLSFDDRDKAWSDRRVEDLLENERKNSKNEINAKLNNQECIMEAKKSFSRENERKIRRIDLKAYGFENEFFSSGARPSNVAPRRVVNKLDLKSFGYDGGLRRTRSNNQIDSTVTVNDADFKPRVVRVTNKSNLTRRVDRGASVRRPEVGENRGAGDRDLTKSSEALNEIPRVYSTLGGMTAAKSVPDMARCDYYGELNGRRDSVDGRTHESQRSKNVEGLEGAGSCETTNGDVERNGGSIGGDSEVDREDSMERDRKESGGEGERNLEEGDGVDSGKFQAVEKKLPLPSVRRLAQAFSKRPDSLPVPAPRAAKLNGTAKDRSSTPEIHIVETPRQMHSLTARSLSKQFREGLRQIPNKVASPPASHVAMERADASDAPSEVVQSNGDKANGDIDVISPGKLKSNIIFWEQMQRRS